MPASASSPRSSRQRACCDATSSATPRPMRSSCSAGVQPSSETSVMPGVHLADQAGDADHEEFVEIVGGDRQEAQPLQQRMVADCRFLQHAAVEFEPRHLAVDEAVRRGHQRRSGRAPRLPATIFGRLCSPRQSASSSCAPSPPAPALPRRHCVTDRRHLQTVSCAAAPPQAARMRRAVGSARGIKPMFLGEHAGGEPRGIVAGQHGNARLRDDLAGVQLRRHPMHRAAVLARRRRRARGRGCRGPCRPAAARGGC